MSADNASRTVDGWMKENRVPLAAQADGGRPGRPREAMPSRLIRMELALACVPPARAPIRPSLT